jgi:hypothetical protein
VKNHKHYFMYENVKTGGLVYAPDLVPSGKIVESSIGNWWLKKTSHKFSGVAYDTRFSILIDELRLTRLP